MTALQKLELLAQIATIRAEHHRKVADIEERAENDGAMAGNTWSAWQWEAISKFIKDDEALLDHAKFLKIDVSAYQKGE